MKIRWTQQAASDLQSLREYLDETNPAAAQATIERILSRIDVLERFPQFGRTGRIEGTRELVITGTPFLVMYRLHHERVQIVAVLHGARKWPRTL